MAIRQGDKCWVQRTKKHHGVCAGVGSDGEDPVDAVAEHFVDRTEGGAVGQARAWADAKYGPGAYNVVPS